MMGTVFKLTPNGSGSWTETILYSFTGPPSGGSDGANPEAGLVFDAAGNLYGTTQFGGPTGTGTVFKLTPSVDGTWNESLLYAFNGADGAHPACVPSFDRAGNLYGTTDMGGAYDYGTVFKLTPSFAGQWTETVLHAFSGGADGGYPSAGVILDDRTAFTVQHKRRWSAWNVRRRSFSDHAITGTHSVFSRVPHSFLLLE